MITYRLSLADSQLLPLLLNKAENMIYGDITYLSEQQKRTFHPVIARVGDAANLLI